MLALFVAVLTAFFAMPHGLLVAEQTSVIVREDITLQYLVDDEGEPTDSGDVKHAYDKAACSGFVAYTKGTKAIIVTANHCAQSEYEQNFFTGTNYAKLTVEPKRVQFFDGDIGIVRKVTSGTADDVAILEVQTMRSHPYAFLDTKPLQRGDDLFAFGTPEDESWTYSLATPTRGSVEIDDGLALQSHAVLLSCPSCGPGDSGGPVFNRAGHVVGTVVAGDSRETAIIPSSRLLPYLKALR